MLTTTLSSGDDTQYFSRPDNQPTSSIANSDYQYSVLEASNLIDRTCRIAFVLCNFLYLYWDVQVNEVPILTSGSPRECRKFLKELFGVTTSIGNPSLAREFLFFVFHQFPLRHIVVQPRVSKVDIWSD